MTEPSAADTWDHGDAYERFIGRWSRRVAPEFLAWLDLPPGLRWLDVGCGTGALSAAVAARCAPASLAAVEPSAGFRATAQRNLGARVEVLMGDALAIPLPAASVDAVVSGLVLNFVPEPAAALAEFRRVASAGGTIAAYVWDYAGRMDSLRAFWDAARALDPAAAALDEGVRFPLCRPGPLQEAFESARLSRVETRAIDIATRFDDFDDFWLPFLGGQGPAPTYAMGLAEPVRAALREAVRERIPRTDDGSISLTARAWAVRGRT